MKDFVNFIQLQETSCLQYAERLPIGLEKVIRMVSPQIVKQFYTNWYNLHNMAVIAVGDFPDTKVLVLNYMLFVSFC